MSYEPFTFYDGWRFFLGRNSKGVFVEHGCVEKPWTASFISIEEDGYERLDDLIICARCNSHPSETFVKILRVQFMKAKYDL